MTAPLKQQLLDALAATLVAAGTTAGKSVYVDHPDELLASMLPAIVIQEGDEKVSTESLGFPHLQQRELEVTLTCVCHGTGSARAARALASQVEAAVFASISTTTLGGLAQGIHLAGSRQTLSGQTSQLLCEQQTHWRISYYTRSGLPGTPA